MQSLIPSVYPILKENYALDFARSHNDHSDAIRRDCVAVKTPGWAKNKQQSQGRYQVQAETEDLFP